MGVILRCILPALSPLQRQTNKSQKLPCVSLFQILSAMYLPNIILIGLQLEKLSQN